MYTREVSRPTRVTGPLLEPLTLEQAKKQLELSPTDTAHDSHLQDLIKAAREQWEHDTGTVLLTSTWSVTAWQLYEDIELPLKPIQSITSVQYYDTGNIQQTASTDYYSLDAQSRTIRRKYLQSWPDTITDRWDAVLITYVAGYASVADVPFLAKQAMKLLVGHYFENRDMIGNFKSDAYDNLVMRFIRDTYP